jgi:LmbE family N-acetylglucosaminyl deacetylase
MKRPVLSLVALIFMAAPHSLISQERGVAALSQELAAIPVTMRVLLIAAHPDDEDTQLITWLTHGQHVETAYLSVTRGDGGQNLIGNELGEALGIIRTAELMSARRIDGARQYFTRGYDFGFSKDTIDTFKHWPRDSLLRDYVRVVRDFAPHVIVSLFSGTPRDGHGQHQISAILAKEVWTAAMDTVRFPVSEFGPAWTPLKFYRSARFSPGEGTLRINVGEYNPVLGRSYYEIAAESRSQHKSQGFGSLQRKGVFYTWLRRDMVRVDAPADPKQEKSLFDGIDITLARLKTKAGAPDAAKDWCMAADRKVNLLGGSVLNLKVPETDQERVLLLDRLGHIQNAITQVRDTTPAAAGYTCGLNEPDRIKTLRTIAAHVQRAAEALTNVSLEATTQRPVAALGDTFTVTTTVYNRGTMPVTVRGGKTGNGEMVTLLPDSSLESKSVWNTAYIDGKEVEFPGTEPRWLRVPRNGDLFGTPKQPVDALVPGLEIISASSQVITNPPAVIELSASVVNRFADPVRGDIQLPFALAPGISVTLDRPIILAQAGTSLTRYLNVTLRSAFPDSREINVRLDLPAGLKLSATPQAATIAPKRTEVPSNRIEGTDVGGARTVTLTGSAKTLTFKIDGALPAGNYKISAIAESGGKQYTAGYVPIEYEHIPPQRMYRPAEVRISSVPVVIPPGLTIAYVPGVGDNVPPTLRDLGIPVTIVEPKDLPVVSLAKFSTVVVGTRAYQANHDLVDNNQYLLDYARNGGTLVVQYGQYEMTQPGMMPYPITLSRPADRVTDETAAITILDPRAEVLNTPNKITQADFENWVQERSLYMPTTFDPKYHAMLSMHDPGETDKLSGILVAPYGKGLYVYTTLSFFRQLPAGNPGATRLFVNLLSAKAPR